MLPYKSNILIFIIEFLCVLLLESVYGVSIHGSKILVYVSVCLIPVLFMALIAVKVKNEKIVIRCLYLSAIFTFFFMSYTVRIQGTLPFMYLAIGVSIGLFVIPYLLGECLICSLVALIIAGIIQGSIVDSNTDMSLYITYVMLYAFASVALMFIIIGVKNYRQEMEEKNEVAQAALEAKSNFLANMSHEIRTPMNAIYGMAELLEEREFSPEDKGYIATIKNSSENLLSIINEILDFSKIDSGKMNIENAPYDVCNMLQDVISIICFRLRDKNVLLETDIAADIPASLIGDEMRIRQILINLLNNAVKFTNRGVITLTMKWENQGKTGGLLRISVKDTGIGISEENLQKLFTAFGQLDTKKNRNVEGTGLGLVICKEIADLMGGSIGVTSVVKEGSEFYVSIPQKVYDPTPCNFKSDLDGAYGINRTQQVSFIAPRAKVLIVDDNKVNQQVARELMKLFGFDAFIAESGQEAIDKVEKRTVKYDVIFMDHMMPFMDGIEATYQIRMLDDDYAKTVPIVALTANAIKGVEKQFTDAGMNDYISKPIRLEHLAEVLKRWIPLNKQYPAGTTSEEIAERERNMDFSRMSREEILDMLEGVDVRAGVKNCAGSVDVYYDLLQTYATSSLDTTLNMYFEREDLENYGVVAHSIKGASRNIGAHDIADKAYSLERAAKRGDINYIWDNHQEMVDEYSSLIRMLKQIFFSTVYNN